MSRATIDIVVGHYNEDLSWLHTAAQDCIVYSKGTPPPPASIHAWKSICQLRNIGREGHTYLHHLATHYDNLADITLFVQGHIDDHVALSIEEMRDMCLKMSEHEVLTFPSTDVVSTELVLFDEWNGIRWDQHPCLEKWIAMDTKRAACTPAQYFARFLGNGKVPRSIGYTSGAVFAVPRKLLYARSKQFYQELLEAMFEGDMAHINPETGYFMERFWLAMWQPDEYVCWNEEDMSKEERNGKGLLAKGRWKPLPKPGVFGQEETGSGVAP
jgi:hypothetical protein